MMRIKKKKHLFKKKKTLIEFISRKLYICPSRIMVFLILCNAYTAEAATTEG